MEQLDLADLSNVRAFAQRFLASGQRLDILVCNAGIMACPLGYTKDGFEMQFGTNHLGHFLLAQLLLDKMVSQASWRAPQGGRFAGCQCLAQLLQLQSSRHELLRHSCGKRRPALAAL